MPDIEVCDLHQFATYWEFDFVDGYGEVVYKDPIQLSVRFESADHNVRPQIGTVDAVMVVGRNLVVSSAVWVGKLVDVPSTQITPEFPKAALYRVIDVQQCSDLKNRGVYREALLMRQGARIPDSE